MSEEMILCRDHAVALCQGVDRHGMGSLVPKLGGKAVVNDKGEKFHPLVTVETMVMMKAMKEWPAVMLDRRPPCPCCEADRRIKTGTGQEWLEISLSLAKQYAVEFGFLKKAGRPSFSLIA